MLLDFTNLSSENTKRLNQIADGIKESYTLFIDEICKKYGKNPLFWATPLASRNTFNDEDSLLSICRIFLTLELVQKEDIRQIITAFICEKKVLEKYIKDIEISSIEKNSARSYIARKKEHCGCLFRFCKKQISYMHYMQSSKLQFGKPMDLIFTPVLASSFDRYYYNDRYFTGITEYKDVVFLPFLNNNTGISEKDFVDRVRNCDNYIFLLPFHFMKIFDLFDLVKYIMAVNRMKRQSFMFGEVDITPIIERFLDRGKDNVTSYKGILARRIIRRMSERNIQINSVLIWYEGRPSDIMIASAIREFYPNINCIGFQGCPIPEINIAYFISNYQYQTLHSPSQMAIPSRMYEPMAHRFCKDIPILYTPILRSKYTIKERSNYSNREKRILVLLSYFLNGTRELIQGIDDYMRKNVSGYQIILKNHPANKEKRVSDYGFSKLSFDPEYVTGRLDDCLENVDVVVTSLTSSTLEVIFAHVPLIILCPQGSLAYSALPKEIEESCAHIVYGPKELSESINDCFQSQMNNSLMIRDMLIPRTRQNVLKLFE